MIVGFIFISLMALWSISPLLQWVDSMQLSKWLTGVLYVVALAVWLCGLSFLYYAEKAVFSKREQ